MSGHRMLRVALVASASAFAMTGCSILSDPDSAAERVELGIAQGWSGSEPDLLTGEPAVGWLSDEEFGVITIGSGSCAPTAASIESAAPAEIRIEFVSSEDDPCTADMSATTHVFAVPEGMVERPIAVTLDLGAEERELFLE